MAAARDRRELRNGRPKQESCGGHESDHDGAPTSLPMAVVVLSKKSVTRASASGPVRPVRVPTMRTT